MIIIFIAVLIAAILLPAPFFIFGALTIITVFHPVIGVALFIAIPLLWSAQ